MLTELINYVTLINIAGRENSQLSEQWIIRYSEIATYHFTCLWIVQFSSLQSLSHVRLFATPWTAARQASLSITKSQSSLKLMSIESVMPSKHLILCRPLLLLHPIPPSIRVFFNESTLRMRWPKYWSFTFSISPSNKYSGLIDILWDGLVGSPLPFF